jgi:FkbM family methyltransferase
MENPSRLQAAAAWAIRARILRGKLSQIAQRAMAGIGHDIEEDGVKLRCHLGDNATERDIFIRGLKAPRVDLMRVVGDLKRGDTFIDVGANCGIFTAFAAKKVGPAGRVIAIEPMPQMLERLRHNVAINGFTNVAIFATAVGETPGVATLHIHPHNRGKSSLVPTFLGSPFEVQVSSLAGIAMAAGLDRIDTLKIDIEGFEDRALIPFISTASQSLWPKRIFMEIVHSRIWQRDCVGFLLDAGYWRVWQTDTDIALELQR